MGKFVQTWLLFALCSILYGSANGQDSMIECSGKPVIRLSPENLTLLGVQELDKVIVSPTTVADDTTLDGACVTTHDNATFHINIFGCGAVTKIVNNDTLEVKYTLRNSPYINNSLSIRRYVNKCIYIICRYNLYELVSSNHVESKINKTAWNSSTIRTALDLTLKICTDSTCATSVSPNTIRMIPSTIYASVEIGDANAQSQNFVVQIIECWAANNWSNTSDPKVYLIKNGCPVVDSNIPSGFVSVTRNYQSSNGRFDFKAFAWKDNSTQVLYLFCKAEVCHSDVSNCSNPTTCSSTGRRRRDTSSTRIISSGPILIQQSKKSACDINNGGCSDLCSVVEGVTTCLCPGGKVLRKDRKTCEVRKSDDKQNIKSKELGPSIVAGTNRLDLSGYHKQDLISAALVTMASFFILFMISLVYRARVNNKIYADC